jgi:hypothetical protein
MDYTFFWSQAPSLGRLLRVWSDWNNHKCIMRVLISMIYRGRLTPSIFFTKCYSTETWLILNVPNWTQQLQTLNQNSDPQRTCRLLQWVIDSAKLPLFYFYISPVTSATFLYTQSHRGVGDIFDGTPDLQEKRGCVGQRAFMLLMLLLCIWVINDEVRQ